MANRILKTGALPYKDGSGFEIEIVVEGPTTHFQSVRLELNPDSEFCSFELDRWPEVRAAIDRAVHAHQLLKQDPTP